MMRYENEEQQKVNNEQAQQLLKLQAEKKELEELVTKQRDEIGKMMEQKVQDDPKKESQAAKTKAIDETKVSRYL